MQWEFVEAKNGEKNLLLNNYQVYSNYRPREDAYRWVESEFDNTASCYLLIGLGLGYHLEKLIELANSKAVYVYYFDDYEKTLFPYEYAVSTIDGLDFSKCQILIPNPWLKALKNHPLSPFLEDIKINQVTYKKTAELLEKNFRNNTENTPDNLFSILPRKVAALVSSGPSLNETIKYLKKWANHLDIFVVGSALKLILNEGIIPTAVVISEAKNVSFQLDKRYRGPLLYLSTANFETVSSYPGEKYIYFQNGYPLAEEYARKNKYQLIDTGGSVATTTFSIVEQLGYEILILFGQDLGFVGEQTHAKESTSGRTVQQDLNLRQIESNDGTLISTTPNLHTYLRWFNRQVSLSKMNVYNTAKLGAKIIGAPLISPQQLDEIMKNL